MKTRLIVMLLITCSALGSSGGGLTIDIVEVTRGGQEPFIWTQARAAKLSDEDGPTRAILTLSKKLKSGEDVYYDLYQSVSEDGGDTWAAPTVIPSLKLHAIGQGYRRSMSDMTPQWHEPSGRVLNVGKSFFRNRVF